MAKPQAPAASLADGYWSHLVGAPGPISGSSESWSKFASSSAGRTNAMTRTHFDPNDEEEWDWLSLIYAMTGCIVLFCAGKVVLLCGTWSFKDYLVAATPSTRRETVDAAAKVPRFEGLVHSGLRR